MLYRFTSQVVVPSLLSLSAMQLVFGELVADAIGFFPIFGGAGGKTYLYLFAFTRASSTSKPKRRRAPHSNGSCSINPSWRAEATATEAQTEL